MNRIEPVLQDGEKEIIPNFHDESVFHHHDRFMAVVTKNVDTTSQIGWDLDKNGVKVTLSCPISSVIGVALVDNFTSALHSL